MKIADEYQYLYLNELHKAGYHILDGNMEIPMPDFLEPEHFPFVIENEKIAKVLLIQNWEDIISITKEININKDFAESDDKQIEIVIEACVISAVPEIILTKRIMEGLKSIVDTKIQMGEFDTNLLMEQVVDFIKQPDVLNFIEKRQPELSKVPNEVINHLKNYFSKNLNAYEITDVFRKSNHPDDATLFSVIGRRKDGYYACWTSWNENMQEINHGHYGLDDKETAISIIKKNFNDITDEIEKYGLENSRVEIVKETQEQEKEVDNIISFRSR